MPTIFRNLRMLKLKVSSFMGQASMGAATNASIQKRRRQKRRDDARSEPHAGHRAKPPGNAPVVDIGRDRQESERARGGKQRIKDTGQPQLAIERPDALQDQRGPKPTGRAVAGTLVA